MQLSCWPRVGAAAVSFRRSRVYLALIHRQQRWQRRCLIALSLLVLSLFLLSLALGEFVLLHAPNKAKLKPITLILRSSFMVVFLINPYRGLATVMK